ncbi:fimbrial protein [Herbaspirillum sp. LeCh32-8]|uniref:fimbrial protein n=1 Tax=Herbaspirillum sp. LeCh32-8 TaxID=2821356 RepID=UPI001AE3EF8E|nr:fimbrial protein [Herbaspirillum sp. LeCh32-8]MBP0598901.1 fimbrial protein [Herbaspirillum sp. LeCh32-8]
MFSSLLHLIGRLHRLAWLAGALALLCLAAGSARAGRYLAGLLISTLSLKTGKTCSAAVKKDGVTSSKQIWRWVLGLAGACMYAQIALAGNCTAIRLNVDPSGPVGLPITNGVSSTLIPIRITVTGDEAPGTVLGISTQTATTAQRLRCTNTPVASGLTGIVAGQPSISVGGWNVLPTDVPGIGFSIATTGHESGIKSYPLDTDGANGEIFTSLTGTGIGRPFTLRIIRIPGTIPEGVSRIPGAEPFMGSWVAGDNKQSVYNFSGAVVITKQASTCQLSFSPSSSVNFGVIPQSKLATANNSGRSDLKFVSLQLTNCSRSVTSYSYSFSISGSSSAVGAACNGTLSNAATDSTGAKGVGIQLGTNDSTGFTPICWNRTVSQNITATTGPITVVNLATALIGLGQPISAGNVIGRALATVNYN